MDEMEVQNQGVGSPIIINISIQYNFSELKRLKKALPTRPYFKILIYVFDMLINENTSTYSRILIHESIYTKNKRLIAFIGCGNSFKLISFSF